MTNFSCANCGSTNWAAANEVYCTSCERQWNEELNKVLVTKDSQKASADAKQRIIDIIFEEALTDV